MKIAKSAWPLLILFALSHSNVFGQSKKAGSISPQASFVPETHQNIFSEAGYSENEIEQKLAKAYHDVFEGPDRVYFEVDDSMAYVSDLKNHDARTEGLSYGMMIAVQLNKKEVFDRIWRWSKKYLQHQDGPREGYFAWSINPQTMKKNAEGSASDGELYFITSLLFASNRWGNNTGINYYAEARRILDAMWKKDGTANIHNIINTQHKQISFVPEGDGYNWTDPSYHVPAFFEVWALYAKDGHEQFYKDCADTARAFLHRACHPVTALNPDYADFGGAPHNTRWMPVAFRYDSWRVPMNIAMDYAWFGKDNKWQERYANRLQNFLRSKGIHSFEDQFNMDGSRPDVILQAGGFKKLRHSIGFVATAASTSMINKEKGFDFVHELWNSKLEPYEDGYFDPYYDGLLYVFSLMHLSGHYKLITPEKPAANAQVGLKDAYKNAFLIGAAVTPAITSGKDKASQNIVVKNCNAITVENVMKAALINPQPGVYNWAPADDYVAFGEKHHMFIVGHTLVWHNQCPDWFFTNAEGKPNTKEEQLERLRTHIKAVAGRYAGRVHAWDVVNEVVDNDGSYRHTSWVNAVGNGDTLVKYAFQFAQQYAPNTELYYNDFNAWRPDKRDGIVRMIRMLKNEGIRVDGVGMQGHWGLNYPETRYIEAAIDSFASCGVKVMITELDVDVLPLTKEGQVIGQVMADKQFQLEEFKNFLDPYAIALPDSMHQVLANRYAELFSIFYRKRDKIARVTLWGVHDGMSWKNDYPVPGRTNYPLLWDRNRQPKPALQAVLNVPAQFTNTKNMRNKK